MLLESNDRPVNPSLTCEQPVEEVCTAQRLEPKKLVLVWRGNGPASVSEWLCWDAAAAYMHAENMAGLRDGDTVILYSLNWQVSWSGRA
jgi:hypothetical protein